jgi:hypothetical protein
MPPTLFALVILEMGVSILAQAGLDPNPPIFHFPLLAGMSGVKLSFFC